MGAHDDEGGAFAVGGLHDLVVRDAGDDAGERGDALAAALGRVLFQRLPGPFPLLFEDTFQLASTGHPLAKQGRLHGDVERIG